MCRRDAASGSDHIGPEKNYGKGRVAVGLFRAALDGTAPHGHHLPEPLRQRVRRLLCLLKPGDELLVPWRPDSEPIAAERDYLALNTAIPADSSTPKTIAATNRLPAASHRTKNTIHAKAMKKRNPPENSRLDLSRACSEASCA
jgi:hypothetical protein